MEEPITGMQPHVRMSLLCRTPAEGTFGTFRLQTHPWFAPKTHSGVSLAAGALQNPAAYPVLFGS